MHPVDAVVILGVAAAAAIVYLISCAVNPRKPCRHCGGAGRHRDPVFRGAHRPCGSCEGSGWAYRRGARMLGRGKDERR